MRLLVGDIDDLSVTTADLSDMRFEGEPREVVLSMRGGDAVTVAPTVAASLDRPTGSTSGDEWFDLSGRLEPPCEATVAWAGGFAVLHAVAYHYCTLDDVLDMGDEKRQSPRQLHRTERDAFMARNRAERVCESICRRTFRATYREEPYDGRPTQILGWPASRLLSGGAHLIGDGLAGLCLARARGPIRYVTGEDAGTPPDVRWAVAKLAAYYLSVSKVPDRAVYESTEAGMTRYTLASETSTGIPDVDAVLARHARRRWAIP